MITMQHRSNKTVSLLPAASAPLLLLLIFLSFASPSSAKTRKFNYVVQYTNATRLCHTKQLVSINGQFPGPTAYVREGDDVIVKVTNMVDHNITIHWHGVKQILSAWADGPAYITQCPIQTGRTYVHRFKIVDQRGTLFYHAHLSWLRATVHGAFIILPPKTKPSSAIYPFTKPHNEFPILISEWWNANVEDVVAEAIRTGAAYNYSDAITINGQPGARYNCSLPDTAMFNVTTGKTYLLRFINAAVNFQMYVGVTGHSLTVVAVDGEYTKQYTTDILVLAAGQTTDVLLTANQPEGQYYIAATVFSPTATFQLVQFTTTPATAILRYEGASTVPSATLPLPVFPEFNNSHFAANFTKSLKGLPYSDSYQVPQTVDEDLFFTIGYGAQPCTTCSNRFGPIRFSAAINNVTFKEPTFSLLEAYYNQINNNAYTEDFPSMPLFQYNYTGPQPNNSITLLGTKVKVLEYGKNVQIVFQDTSTFFFEGHPLHLHGQNFYIVGEGVGTFNATRDTPTFNLVDPPSRNTVGVPSGGWAAVRFVTHNPGMWFMHCHFDIHSTWGMAMAFIVKNGVGPSQTLPPPPADLPAC